ncbi:hypothetical protein HMPREF9554_00911 [Treponema phagedenis F0421]|nr:hypothetical protein HMPREF9554_00911 [Treponema phagedenis F0421]
MVYLHSCVQNSLIIRIVKNFIKKSSTRRNGKQTYHSNAEAAKPLLSIC